MADDADNITSREQQLDEILTSYLQSVDAGRVPDRQALLDRYPELAADLAEFFAEQDLLDRWAESLRPVALAARLPTLVLNVDRTIEEAATLKPGSPLGTIGSYELLRVLGKGGMGVVYEARHRELNRLVALKMLPGARWVDPEEIKRFRNEAEAVAHLDHPHIVPIYDVGEHDGQPYFTMKPLAGGSLAGQLPHFAEDPRAAARLVATVARAIHYAHQRGILHRDLKPANVLLDGEGQPHVTDFGLAKRLDAGGPAAVAELTATGAILGTPGFMAPEQATGEKGAVTTASDVYGLGTILYALLTGRAPFEGTDVFNTLVRVRHSEPEPPGKRNPRVDRDLGLICLKCLEKPPQRRYPSAEALAEELERYLDGRSLAHTRPVSAAERLWRWCKRNRAAAAVVATIFLALLAVTVVSLVWNVQLQASNEELRKSQAETEANGKLAFDAVKKLLTQVTAREKQERLGPERFRRESLKEVKKLCEQLIQLKSGDPSVVALRGLAYRALAQAADELGSPRDAAELYQQAREIFEQLIADHPEQSSHQAELANILHDLGILYQNLEQFTEAKKIYDQAVPLRRKLVKAHPDQPDLQERLARTIHQEARLYKLIGQTEQSKKLNAEALPMFEQLARQKPGEPELQYTLAGTYHNLGMLQNTPAEGQAMFDKAIALCTKLVRKFPAVSHYTEQLAASFHSRGMLYAQNKQFAKAKADFDAALPYRQRLVREHEKVPVYQYGLANLFHSQGLLFLDLKQWRKATSTFEEALLLSEKLADHPQAKPLYKEQRRRLLYCAACGHSRVAEADGKEGKRELAEQEAAHAVELLRKTWQAGFFNSAKNVLVFSTDADLQALRGRRDFQKLQAAIEKEFARKKKASP
jgi:tetratricopeptide (TPR) repeat protein